MNYFPKKGLTFLDTYFRICDISTKYSVDKIYIGGKMMTKIKVPTALTVSVHGEGQHLFEPMAARCTCTTIISSSSTF